MAQIELLEIDERCEPLYPGDPIRLEREDLERSESRQVLVVSAMLYTSSRSYSTSSVRILFFPNHSSSSSVNDSRFSITCSSVSRCEHGSRGMAHSDPITTQLETL